MPNLRHFLSASSQAGTFHVVSRASGREYRLGGGGKGVLLTKTLHAYATLLGVQVLTHHFHMLLRVPERPEGESGEGGPSVEQLLVRLEAAVGVDQMKQIRQNLRLWESNSAQDLIEAWRQRQVGAMYSLSEFMKRVKQRFTRWYNKRTGRVGIFWEDRYRSTIVQESSGKRAALSRQASAVHDEEKALCMMATYIDLNPVRAGITDDPGNHLWSGYAEAMAGKAEALEGIARITGATSQGIEFHIPLEFGDHAIDSAADTDAYQQVHISSGARHAISTCRNGTDPP